jgi:collagenase-like PrtC family protease
MAGLPGRLAAGAAVAIDAGADAVYLGLKDATNARNFAGLNFDDAQVREGVAYAHARGRRC